MTELQLYKFITENNLEWHWGLNEKKRDVVLFVNIRDIQEWYALFPNQGIFDDDGIACVMKDGYFCFWMEDICAYYGIEIKDIFTKENWDE
jgi:hypothetical protein